MEDYDSKDIFLKKGDHIVGLHAIGHTEDHQFEVHELDGTVTLHKTDFMELEKWGNSYDENLNMVGGSFRIHDLTIEHTAAEFEKEGWYRFTPRKSFTSICIVDIIMVCAPRARRKIFLEDNKMINRLVKFVKGFGMGIAMTALGCAAIGVGFLVMYLILSTVGNIIESVFHIDLAEYMGLQIFGILAAFIGLLAGLGEAFDFDPFAKR